MDYFPSAEAMAADLDLELLLRAEVDRRMLTRKERLSQFAADATVAGHLYGRVRDQLAREKGGPDLRGKILWMTAPFATVEHLTWAVGLADQITRQRGRVYLAAASIETMLPARTGIRGEALPDAVQNRLRAWLNVPSYSVGTDLEGVRMVVPVTAHDVVGPAPDDPDWTVLLLDPLPEDYDGPYPKPGSVDGVVLVTAFRDHSVSELQESVAGLRRAGLPLFGVVGMGPQRNSEPEGGSRPPRRSASIWRTDAPPPPPKESAPPRESGPPKVVALPGIAGRDPLPRPSEPPETRRADSEESTWARLGRTGREGQGPGRAPDGPVGGAAGRAGGASRGPAGSPRETARKPSPPPTADVRKAGGSPGAPGSTPGAQELPGTSKGPGDAAAPAAGSASREATPVGQNAKERSKGRAAGRKGRSKKSGRSRPEVRVAPGAGPDPSGKTSHATGASSGFERKDEGGGKEGGSVWSELPTPLGAAKPRPGATAAPGTPAPPVTPSMPSAASGGAPTREQVRPSEAPGVRTRTPSAGPAQAPPSPARPADSPAPPVRPVDSSPGRPGEAPPARPVDPTSRRPAEAPPSPVRPAETPAPEPVVSNVTPLRVTPGSRSGSGRSLTPEERSVALLTGWQRERQRHAAHGSRVTLWISSVVVVLGLVGAFYLMRPTLIASGRLPAWLGGPQKTTAQQTPANGQSQARNATSSSPNRTTAPPQERADDSQVSAWDSSERDELLAELRERAHASPGDPEALEGMPPEERSLEGWPPRERTDPPHVPTTLERNGAEPVNERATAESPGAGPMDEATITDPPMRGEADAPTTLDAPADESASVSRTSERIGAAEDVREEFRSDPALLAENPAARAEPESSEPFSEDQDEPLASGSAPVGSDPSTNAPVSTSTQSTGASGSAPVGSDRSTNGPGSTSTQSTGASGSPSSGSTQSDPRAEQGSAPGSLQQGQAGSSQTSSSLGPISHAAEATIQVSHAERDGSSEGAAETAEGTGVEAAAEPVGTAPAIAPGDSYVVHLGSFRLRREADAEVARLLGLGYDARALHVNVPGKGPWYRVVIGAFATFEEARENALILATTTGRNRPNVVGAGGYGAPVPILEESESPGKATP